MTSELGLNYIQLLSKFQMAAFIDFLSNSLVSAVLLGYIIVMWIALTVWTAMDIFSRTKNWFVRFGAIVLVGFGSIFGFVLYLIVRPLSTIEEQKVREMEEKILENQSRAYACPSCLALVREDFLFCPSCGLNIKRECPSCKRGLEVSWTQCPFCGAALGTVALPTIQESTKLLGETPNGPFFSVFRRLFSAPRQPSEIKRKRGRPRKPAPIGPIIKRPRGRPRKNAAQPVSI